MERILLVEDNKALAKLIAKKIAAELPFEIDIAFNLNEAKLFIRGHRYFIALLDINLPDAPHGEVVDVILEHGIPSIVLSGQMDKTFRHDMLKKEIIDYVGKGGIEDINYIIATIARLHKNRGQKVLLVDDSRVFRNQMKAMLSNLFFEVFATAHGEEAINLLGEHPDVKIVLTDYAMPVMDGIELTKTIRKTFPKERLTIFGISSTNDDDISAMFLKSGATDYLKKPFSKEEFSCRINNAIEALENIDAITNYANRDFLTGLYSKHYFFTAAADYFEKAAADEISFALAMISIDNTEKIGGAYGKKSTEKAIVHLSELLMRSTSCSDMVAHFGRDEFCILFKNTSAETALRRMELLQQKVHDCPLIADDGREIPFTVSIGLALSTEDSLDDMISCADMMLYNAKNDGQNQIRG